jgi:hypothetical protein
MSSISLALAGFQGDGKVSAEKMAQSKKHRSKTEEAKETVCFCFFGFFGRPGGLKSELCACKPGALLLKPNIQFIFHWLFGRWGLMNYLLRLALNHSPPDLSLPSS